MTRRLIHKSVICILKIHKSMRDDMKIQLQRLWLDKHPPQKQTQIITCFRTLEFLLPLCREEEGKERATLCHYVSRESLFLNATRLYLCTQTCLHRLGSCTNGGQWFLSLPKSIKFFKEWSSLRVLCGHTHLARQQSLFWPGGGGEKEDVYEWKKTQT